MKLEREEASIVYWVANKEPDECIEYWKVIFVKNILSCTFIIIFYIHNVTGLKNRRRFG